MRHSPEPWRLYFGNGDAEIEIADANNVFVASLDSEVPEEYDHYNASRIVDCVNNCAGINPDSVPLLLEACEDCLEWIKGMCNALGEATQPEDVELMDKIESILKKARGE